MQVGYLPYLPHPVNDQSTVYTAFHNFLDVLQQLEQKSLPVICDESVYRFVVEILLQRPMEFDNLVPMLDGFHFEKAVEHCIGKYFRGSGIEYALIETGIFGLKVIKSVLGGTHYVRSLRCLLIVSEARSIMQWEAFWSTKDRNNYNNILTHLQGLIEVLKSKALVALRLTLELCVLQIISQKNEFEHFCFSAGESSELCRYWNSLQTSIRYLKDLITADRNGDWENHLLSVQKLLPIFAECDSINYLRYGMVHGKYVPIAAYPSRTLLGVSTGTFWCKV